MEQLREKWDTHGDQKPVLVEKKTMFTAFSGANIIVTPKRETEREQQTRWVKRHQRAVCSGNKFKLDAFFLCCYRCDSYIISIHTLEFEREIESETNPKQKKATRQRWTKAENNNHILKCMCTLNCIIHTIQINAIEFRKTQQFT